MPKVFQTWARVGPLTFTANGTSNGTVTVASTIGFYHGQVVVVKSNTQNIKNLQVKRVLSATQLAVGPIDRNPDSWSALDLYLVADSASIEAPEQRYDIDAANGQVLPAVYENHPVAALRNLLVDPIGNPYTNANPLPVNASVSVGPISVDLDAFNLTPDNVLVVGSEDGTKTGIKRGWVNNLRQQILSTQDRSEDYTYLDSGNKNERISQIDYTSATFPGITVRRVFAYNFINNRYVLDTSTWSIV